MQEKADSGALKCPDCGYVEGTEATSPLFLPPRTILEGKYLIGRVLGQGGFGITYLAWDANLNVKLAIKEYFPQDLASRAAGHSQVSAYSGSMGSQYEYGLDKFLQEARTLAQFEGHPNIVSVRDYFKANGTAYFVMSYVEGITLKDHLENAGGTLPIDQALGVIMPVMDALKEVHAVNVLHRDISPDNIFINRRGQVILIDFGAARQAIGEKGRSLSIILKPGYAPEEQYRSKGEQGPWTDIYAMAATVYHLITGQQPPEALERLVDDNMTPPSQLGLTLQENEEQALIKALAVRAQDRFQTVHEFQAALMGDRLSESVTPPVSVAQKDKKSKVKKDGKKTAPLGLIIGLIVLVLAAVGGYYLWMNDMLAFGAAPTIEEQPEIIEEPDATEEVEVIVANFEGNTTGNLVNGGLAAVQGNWIYFRSNEGGSLYRGNLVDSGSGARIIGTDAAWFINVSGDFIFYSNRDDNNRLYRIKIDGSDRLALTDGGAWFVTLVDGWIYYVSEDDEYRIYKINIDGSGRIRISDDTAWFINVVDEWIYYINRSKEDTIYRIKTDASENTQITDYTACCINVYDDWIYHSNENDGSKLYKIRPDGSDGTALTDHPAWFINVTDNWIYYVNEEDAFTVHKMGLDGSGRIKLTSEPARYINVIGNWLFYLDHAEKDAVYKVRLDGTGLSYAESGL